MCDGLVYGLFRFIDQNTSNKLTTQVIVNMFLLKPSLLCMAEEEDIKTCTSATFILAFSVMKSLTVSLRILFLEVFLVTIGSWQITVMFKDLFLIGRQTPIVGPHESSLDA